MSEYSPESTPSGWLSKRYLGVPVVYLAGALVAILVIVAYLGSKKKNTTGAPASTAATVPVDPYSGLATTGTVTTGAPTYYVAPNTQNIDTGAATTEQQWQSQAISALTSTGVSAIDAQAAVLAYTNGQDMTYAQKALVDAAIVKIGLPPVVASVGNVAAEPEPVVNYADINIYSSFYRRRSDQAIMGVLKAGGEHHITLPEWLSMGHPDNLVLGGYTGI
jgi:hypothetical protein